MKRLFIFCGIFFFPFLIFSQTTQQTDKLVVIDSVVVTANRATQKSPIVYTVIGKNEIRNSAPNFSLPLLLKLQPSVVSTTESGSGFGYSRISVRGSDATRINVTLNGVSINDAESQEVFWVNIPSISNFLESVQLQRGIGTSVNGPGSFGASINMQTLFTASQGYGEASASYGSFNTANASIGAGTGLLPYGLSFDIKYNRATTDGYIRNGKADLHSLYTSIGVLKGANAFKINYMMGDQHTGITWDGVSREMLEKDRRSNLSGSYYDEAGNLRYYDNETDNYIQHFVQAFYSHQFANGLLWSSTFNFTKGDGYYENYKWNKKYSTYGLEPQTIDGITYKKSDFIIRQLMDNQYYVASTNLKYDSKNIRTAVGLNYSYYDGRHFGKMLWSKWNANIPDDYSWYDNSGYKWETNTYLKGEFDLSDFTLYADIQYRHIDFQMVGEDKDFVSLDYSKKYNFINPKGGVNYKLNDKNTFYASYSFAHKEPSRGDIKEAIKAKKGDEIRAERMHDIEIGYKYTGQKFSMVANLYFMEYKDQLVATGKISETGYVIKENIPNSYRRGIELSAGWQIIKILRLDGNITLSMNKIKDYTAYVNLYDNSSDWNPLPQLKEEYKKTDLTLSPSIIGMAMLTLEPIKNGKISIDGKYVGKQYYDNTSSNERSLPQYFVMGGNISYELPFKRGSLNFSPTIVFSVYIDNILNNKYISNAWVYRALFADNSNPYIEEGFFPQATTNVIGKIALRF